ncbi:ABC transporter substrate-binding protein [Serratia oryzae]|uniref:Sugar ABC transporter substrate-binding protein n=1 Tax=Serratia oryzae TaxID=2034155 RepID=A0A1S8CL99_9GAMM|nr:ABC transporter substrate-binding protein [Serratia oryzae]OMQ23771.1 sugar ABC transporter substrate-binding protein [Serratia oryzae]
MRKKMKNTLFSLAIIAASCAALTGCDDNAVASENEKQAITLWIAPNNVQEAFWSEVVGEWNKQADKKKVVFSTIPAAGSSEEAIMNAIASDRAPDISENIFTGFGTQLADLGQIVDLSTLDGYQALIQARQMNDIMQNWSYNGKNYILPIYINPVLFWWRGDLLQEQGFSGIPQTYAEIYALSEKYTIADKRYALQATSGRNWWDRWFDFIALYYAQSHGKPYIANQQATYDNQAGRDVIGFLNTLFEKKWTVYDFGQDDPLATGKVLGAVRGPWDISRYQQQYPEILKQIKIGPMLVKDQQDTPHTFADGKGLVLFSHSKVKPEAWEFIQWVFSQPKFDKRWVELTGMPPARADLLTNPMFAQYYQENPYAAAYAKYVNVAVPPASSSETVEIQRSMTQMLEKTAFKTLAPDEALQQSVQEVNALLKP